jgi:hypothetical protein
MTRVPRSQMFPRHGFRPAALSGSSRRMPPCASRPIDDGLHLSGSLIGHRLQKNLQAFWVGRRHDQRDASSVRRADGARGGGRCEPSWEEAGASPARPCTHGKTPPCRGAHPKATITRRPLFRRTCAQEDHQPNSEGKCTRLGFPVSGICPTDQREYTSLSRGRADAYVERAVERG